MTATFWRVRALGVLVCALLAIPATAGPASATLSAVGPIDAATGLPTYYQDETGLQVQPCLTDPTNCVPTTTVPDPTQPPSVYTGNLAPEIFYYAADATMPAPAGGQALLTVGLENGWTSTTTCGRGFCPEPGKQAIFGRVRFRIDNLTPGVQYTIRYPWGTQVVTPTASGRRSVNLTLDTGCAATAGAVACDPSLALQAILGPFLGWDPAQAPAAPAGFLGAYGTAHRITGSRVLDPTGAPQNYFSIEGPDIATYRTDLFNVAGQIYVPPAPDVQAPTDPGSPPAVGDTTGAGTLPGSVPAPAPAIDTTAPSAPAAVSLALAGGTLGTDGVPVRLAWGAATDASGIAGYDVTVTSTDGGTALTTSATGTAATVSLAPGHAYSARVRAKDASPAGNVGAWTSSPPSAVVAAQENATTNAYAGRWKRSRLTGAYGGSVQVSSVAGASASFPFSGTSVGWVATAAPDRGQAVVLLDGVQLPGTVDLYAARTAPRQIVLTRSGLAPGPHTLQVKLLGTKSAASKGKNVDVDAFLALS